MDSKYSSYSPHILIYLEVEEKRIRLADVLYESATLYEQAEIPANTPASLVFSIDGVEEHEEICLLKSVSKEDTQISFSYSNSERLNGRQLSVEAV